MAVIAIVVVVLVFTLGAWSAFHFYGPLLGRSERLAETDAVEDEENPPTPTP